MKIPLKKHLFLLEKVIQEDSLRNRFLEFIRYEKGKKSLPFEIILKGMTTCEARGHELEKAIGQDLNEAGFSQMDLNKIRKKLSELLELFISFEAHEFFRQSSFLKAYASMKAAHFNQWDNYFPWVGKKAQKQFPDLQKESEDWHHFQLTYADLHDQFLVRQKKELDFREDRFQQEENALENIFAIRLLKIQTNRLTVALVGKHNQVKSSPFLEPLTEDLTAQPGKYGLLANIYFKIYQGLKAYPRETNYFLLKKLIWSAREKIGVEEMRIVCQHLNNYLVLRYNYHLNRKTLPQSTFYKREIKKQFGFQFSHGIWLKKASHSSYLDKGEFINVVMLYLKMKDFPRAEKFIEENSSYLPQSKCELAQHYAKGLLHFFKENFPEACRTFDQILASVSIGEDPKLIMNSRVYYLRSRFELGRTDPFNFKAVEREAKNYQKAQGVKKFCSPETWNSYSNFMKNINRISLRQYKAHYQNQQNYLLFYY